MAKGPYPIIVLAAGASRRMGRPKPLLDFGGRACLERVVEAAGEGGCEPIVVVLGAEAERIRAGCRFAEDVRIVLNAGWARGQTSSLKAGLRESPADRDAFFVLPGDSPLVEAADVAALSARFVARGARDAILVPEHGGRRGHPVLIGMGHRDAVLALGDDEPLSAYIRREERHVELLPVENAGIAARMNTAEDYEAALGAWRARRGRTGRP